MSARFLMSFLIAKQLFKDSPQVPPETANRAAVMSSLPMVVSNPVVPVVLAQETKTQIVENQTLQATVRTEKEEKEKLQVENQTLQDALKSRLDPVPLVEKLEKLIPSGTADPTLPVKEEEIKGAIIYSLINGFDSDQFNLIIEAAKKLGTVKLLALLGGTITTATTAKTATTSRSTATKP